MALVDQRPVIRACASGASKSTRRPSAAVLPSLLGQALARSLGWLGAVGKTHWKPSRESVARGTHVRLGEEAQSAQPVSTLSLSLSSSLSLSLSASHLSRGGKCGPTFRPGSFTRADWLERSASRELSKNEHQALLWSCGGISFRETQSKRRILWPAVAIWGRSKEALAGVPAYGPCRVGDQLGVGPELFFL